MKHICLALLFVASAGCAQAQTNRLTLLQGARNVVVSTDSGEHYYLVTSERSRMIRRKDGRLVVEGDTLSSTSSLRLKVPTKFAVDEDSAAFNAKYSVDHGLLAFRRTMNVGRWNSIVVPFSLTGEQLCDAFGEGTQLAGIKAATDDPVPTLEYQSIDTHTSDVVLQAHAYYLIKPTRQPDIEAGRLSTVAYGSGKVAGPVYAIANVTMEGGQSSPGLKTLTSESKSLKLRMRGYYSSHEGDNQLKPSTNTRYLLNDEGRFFPTVDSISIKAFRSMVEDASNEPATQLRFYIDGIGEDITETSGIDELNAQNLKYRTMNSDAVYDLQGRRIQPSTLNPQPSTLKRGLYIINGRKVIIR